MSDIAFDNIPHVLRERPHWVVWRYETRKGQTKPTKVLYNPHTGARAKSNAAETWGTFAQVCDLVRGDARVGNPRSDSRYDGIGFVVTKNDPFCGIDLDDCINLETGEIDAQAAEIVARLDSYTEITVSGKGLRIWVQGTLPPGKRRVGHIEMYDDLRFFTVTGHLVAGSPGDILSRQDALAALHTELFAVQPPPQPSGRKSPDVPLSLSDQDILHKAQEARNGAKFRQLYYTGHSGPDQSASDMALCNLLAFWAGGDAATMDRLFRGSALMRAKWDERHGGDGRTYGQMTVARALADCREVYSPGQGDDGYTTIAKAADALGISRMTANKWSGEPDVLTKRSARGTLLVNLESLRQCSKAKNCKAVNQEGENTVKFTTTEDESCKPVKHQTVNFTTSEGENCKPDNQETVNFTTLQPDDDDDVYDRLTPPEDGADTPGDGAPVIISNNHCTWIETEKGKKPVYFAHRMGDIYMKVSDVTSGWPRRVGVMLFIDREGEIQFLEKHPDYYAWLADYGALSWRTGLSHDNQSFATKEELFSYTASHAELFEDIANIPHEPPIAGYYYSWRPVADYTPTGEYFEKLLSFFTNVETELDALMIRAMFMTPAWGGPLKERPAFAITAPDRGCGKSTLADAVGSLYGGLIDINLSKRAEEEILQRLLTPSARLLRIVRLDNIKGEVNSPLLDALITTTHVSGKQMYKGEAKRPNTLVYLLTGNALRLSRDMAERCFIIHLAKPEYIADWQYQINKFINEYQHYILMDIVAELQKPAPRYDVSDRWASFVTEVLSRCGDAAEVIGAILLNSRRRGGTDTDMEEAEIMLETIMNLQGEYTSHGWYFITRAAAVTACNDALNTRLPTRTLLNILREHTDAGRMHGKLQVDYKAHGGRRGVLCRKEQEDLFAGAEGA